MPRQLRLCLVRRIGAHRHARRLRHARERRLASTEALDDVFGPVESWERVEPAPGTPVGKPVPLFTKVDLDELLADEAPATDG